jgi:Glutamine synthetase adenylyltransferase
MSANLTRGGLGRLRPEVRKRRDLSSAGFPMKSTLKFSRRELTKALTEQTREGYVYRVDLRLRAEGSVGQLTRSLDDYAKYYRTRGQVWERLALLKAWPIAGSKAVGRSFIKMVRPFVLAPASKRLDVEQGLAIVEEVRSVKERIDAKMANAGMSSATSNSVSAESGKSNFSSKRSRYWPAGDCRRFWAEGPLVPWCDCRRPGFYRESNRPL